MKIDIANESAYLCTVNIHAQCMCFIVSLSKTSNGEMLDVQAKMNEPLLRNCLFQVYLSSRGYIGGGISGIGGDAPSS